MPSQLWYSLDSEDSSSSSAQRHVSAPVGQEWTQAGWSPALMRSMQPLHFSAFSRGRFAPVGRKDGAP